MDRFGKSRRRVVAALALVGATWPLVAQQSPQAYHRLDTLDHRTVVRLAGIDDAAPPRVYQGLVAFTYRPPAGTFTRYVAAAFAHEGYGTLHVYDVLERGSGPLFLLAYHPDPDLRELEYRIIVDGVWMVDPELAAPDVRRDASGIEFGTVELPPQPLYRFSSPDHGADGTTTFRFSLDPRVTTAVRTVTGRSIPIEALSGRRVSVVGSFNGWDPFSHPMEREQGTDRYSVTVPLPPGRHHYYYLVDGERVLDPVNEARGFDPTTGGTVSATTVPR